MWIVEEVEVCSVGVGVGVGVDDDGVEFLD